MKKFLINNLWWVTFLLALAFLVSHALSLDKIKVDNTSIILLLVILISPFVSAIKKVKFGEFEAEIDPKEVRRLKEDVEAKMGEYGEDAVPQSPAIRSTIEAIESLSIDDPVLALAKLRIEIEKIVTKLHHRAIKDSNQKKIQPLNKMINDLIRNKLLFPDIANPLREVIIMCNRAVHGEDIRHSDVESIIDIGSYLLETLYIKSKLTLSDEEPESTTIDPSAVDKYRKVRYRLTTIIPYSEDLPIQNVRILDQDGLDAFFDGYNEFAEFVVDLRIIEE